MPPQVIETLQRTRGPDQRVHPAIKLLLLLLPQIASLATLPQTIRNIIVAYLFLINFYTLLLFAQDKCCAITRTWRIKESQLHRAEFLGGWPASFIAQRCLRHKIWKENYQVVFWQAVIFHVVIWSSLLLFESVKMLIGFSRWQITEIWMMKDALNECIVWVQQKAALWELSLSDDIKILRVQREAVIWMLNFEIVQRKVGLWLLSLFDVRKIQRCVRDEDTSSVWQRIGLWASKWFGAGQLQKCVKVKDIGWDLQRVWQRVWQGDV